MLKSGEKAISTVVRRTPNGRLEFNVKLHPAVEEFMKASAGEEFTPVELYDRRKWISAAKLNVYDIPEMMKGATMISGQANFRLDRPGGDMVIIDQLTGLRTINMSFTRLVGASLEDGITFSIAGAFNRDDVTWIASAITEAGNIICKQYIYPMIISSNIIVRQDVVPGGLQQIGG